MAKLEKSGRNIIDSGKQYTAVELLNCFWTITAVRKGKTTPVSLQLTICRAQPRHLIINPKTEDKNGEPLYIIGKFRNTTNLTLGRYSGVHTYTRIELGLEPRDSDVVVFDYGKNFSNFSEHGDSGSLIFTSDGDGLVILHSSMP